MKSCKYYPPEVFSINETRTRLNMAAYDRAQAQIDAQCSEINPRYTHLGLIERAAIKDWVNGYRPRNSAPQRILMKRLGIENLTEEILAQLGNQPA